MRDNLERVHVVLTKDQHQRFKEYASRFHGSVSQFIRMASENELTSNSDKEELKLRPIYDKLNQMEIIVRSIERKLLRIEKVTEYLTQRIGTRGEKIAGDIEELLLAQNYGLSIPEMKGYLPYEQEELIRGIEYLEERFAVKRQGRINAPSKWMIRGNSHDNQ